MNLTEKEELFLAYLENAPSVASVARQMDIPTSTAYQMYGKLKDVIIDRARANLAMGALKASRTALEMMDADASTEKGELRLSAAEKVMDRVGLTKHTNVEVSIEAENGLFILPTKVPLAAVEASDDDLADE
jgi:transposase-like protein